MYCRRLSLTNETIMILMNEEYKRFLSRQAQAFVGEIDVRKKKEEEEGTNEKSELYINKKVLTIFICKLFD